MQNSFLTPTYLFIDGGHLRQYYTERVSEWFQCKGDIRFEAIKLKAEAVRLFYYDCVDESPRPNEDKTTTDSRVQTQRDWLDSIRAVTGSHVRLGTLTGAKIKRQKEVDILLAVEMMSHAVRQNMKRAVLVIGDRDFKPLVDSLVQMGVFVEVWGDSLHSSNELMMAADARRSLTFSDYFSFTSDELTSRYPIPRMAGFGGLDKMTYPGQKLSEGLLGNIKVTLIRNGKEFWLYVPKPDEDKADIICSRDRTLVSRYPKILYGEEVEWTTTWG